MFLGVPSGRNCITDTSCCVRLAVIVGYERSKDSTERTKENIRLGLIGLAYQTKHLIPFADVCAISLLPISPGDLHRQLSFFVPASKTMPVSLNQSF